MKAKTALLTIWIRVVDFLIPFWLFPRLNEWILVHTTPNDGP